MKLVFTELIFNGTPVSKSIKKPSRKSVYYYKLRFASMKKNTPPLLFSLFQLHYLRKVSDGKTFGLFGVRMFFRPKFDPVRKFFRPKILVFKQFTIGGYRGFVIMKNC